MSDRCPLGLCVCACVCVCLCVCVCFVIKNEMSGYVIRRLSVGDFKRAGYSLDIMRQTACLVFNPIMVEGYAALFSCTAVVQASDSMTASM